MTKKIPERDGKANFQNPEVRLPHSEEMKLLQKDLSTLFRVSENRTELEVEMLDNISIKCRCTEYKFGSGLSIKHRLIFEINKDGKVFYGVASWDAMKSKYIEQKSGKAKIFVNSEIDKLKTRKK
jgi:hypothetical protein